MSFVTSMFSGQGTNPKSYELAGDIIQKNQDEESRLNQRRGVVENLAALAGDQARTLGETAERQRLARVANPNPWMTTGYGGVASSRTLGADYLLGT